MIQDGAARPRSGSGPWLGLFMTLVLAVIGVITTLSVLPQPLLQKPELDLSAPQVLAPSAPTPMR
jgi:hypothetical protein